MTKAAPAVLVNMDADAIARLKTALATAMGQAQVELGPGDLTLSSEIAVLPRRAAQVDDRSLAMPTIFQLEIAGGACFVVGPNGAREQVEGLICRPA